MLLALLLLWGSASAGQRYLFGTLETRAGPDGRSMPLGGGGRGRLVVAGRFGRPLTPMGGLTYSRLFRPTVSPTLCRPGAEQGGGVRQGARRSPSVHATGLPRTPAERPLVDYRHRLVQPGSRRRNSWRSGTHRCSSRAA